MIKQKLHEFDNNWYRGQCINNIPVGFWLFKTNTIFGKHNKIFYL